MHIFSLGGPFCLADLLRKVSMPLISLHTHDRPDGIVSHYLVIFHTYNN